MMPPSQIWKWVVRGGLVVGLIGGGLGDLRPTGSRSEEIRRGHRGGGGACGKRCSAPSSCIGSTDTSAVRLVVFSVAFGLGHLVQGRDATVITGLLGGRKHAPATAVEAFAGALPWSWSSASVGGEGRVRPRPSQA